MSSGAFGGSTLVPPGVPPGTELYFQYICQDFSTVYDLTLSNAVRATFP